MTNRPTWRWPALAAILIGTFVGTLGNSLANVAVPSIMDDFGVPLSSAVWVMTIYVLVLAVFMPVGGYLGDLYGRRRVYLWSMGLFTLATVATGLAPTFPALLGARTLLGIGIAPTVPAVMAMIAAAFGPGERGRAMGFWALANASAYVVGPPVSGFLIDHLGWRAAFLSSLPLCVVNILAVWWLVPADNRHERRSFDFVGAGALMVMVLSLMLALTQGARWGWTSAAALALWATSLLALVVFVAVERRVPVPFVDLRLLTNRRYDAATVVIAAQNMAFFGLMLALPIYLIQGQGWSSQNAGLLILPLPIVMSIVAPPAGRLTDTWGSRRACALGMSLIVAGGLVLLALRPGEAAVPWPGLVAGLVVIGAGMGLVQTPVTVAVTGIVRHEEMGVATGIFHMARFVSGSLGTLIFGLLLDLNPGGTAGGFAAALVALVIIAALALPATLLLPGRLRAQAGARLPAREA